MDSVELNRLRALLATRALDEAARRPGPLAWLVVSLGGVLAHRLSTRGRFVKTPADTGGAPVSKSLDLTQHRSSPSAAVSEAAAQPVRELLLEAYAMTGFEPRRTAFGFRDGAASMERARAPSLPEPLDNPTATPVEPWAPQSGGFQPHDAETPFFPEDLSDGQDADTPIWMAPRRRLALARAPQAVAAPNADHSVPPALARDYLLADLASRIAGEQSRLDTQRLIAQGIRLSNRDVATAHLRTVPAKAA